MDKQLACATYATLIPVFLIGGFFTRQTLREWVDSVPVVAGVIITLIAAVVGETAAISGTGAGHATTGEVWWAGYGATITALSMLLVTGYSVAVAVAEARRKARTKHPVKSTPKQRQPLPRGRGESAREQNTGRPGRSRP